jgi:hypothetical protein
MKTIISHNQVATFRHLATFPFFDLDAIAVNCASASAQHVAVPSVLNRAPDVEQRLATSVLAIASKLLTIRFFLIAGTNPFTQGVDVSERKTVPR